MSSTVQLLSRGVHMVYQRPPQVCEISIERWAARLEVFIEPCVCTVLVQASFLGACPPSTHISCTPNIRQATSCVLTKINKPPVLVPLGGRQVDIPPMDRKLPVEIMRVYCTRFCHVTTNITFPIPLKEWAVV